MCDGPLWIFVTQIEELLVLTLGTGSAEPDKQRAAESESLPRLGHVVSTAEMAH